MGLVSNIEDVLTVSRANLRGEERMADLIEFSVRLASEESMADLIEAEVIWGLKGSAQFSPVQSSPAHLEFNLNPCQLHKFSTVQVEVNFNTLVRWTVISAQGSLIHCSS